MFNNMSTNQSIIIQELRKNSFIFIVFSLDAPQCAHRGSSIQHVYTGLRRPINLTCFMHEGNPPKLNFTWILPNHTYHKGFFINSTLNILTVTPKQLDDFGSVTCRAQNELDLVGECRINIVMGGK